MNLSLTLGYDLDGDPVIFEANGNAHFTITGKSGYGKSYKLADLILQNASQNVHTVILDGSGEYGQEAAGKPPAWPPRNARFLDITSPELPIGTFFPWAMPSGKMETPSQCARRAAGTLKDLFHLGEMQYALLNSICQGCMQEDDILSFDDIREKLEEFTEESAIRPKVDAKLAERAGGILRRLEVLRDFPAVQDDWFDAFSQPGTTIIDIQDIANPYMLKTVTEILLGNLWTHKVRSATGCPLVLVFDECQDLDFSSGSVLDRILRKGRKHDIAGWFSTQWIKNKEMEKALGQSACNICFRPVQQDFKRTAALLAPNDKELYEACIDALTQMKPGWFFFYDKEEPVLVDGWEANP